jgi:hypothetical protein
VECSKEPDVVVPPGWQPEEFNTEQRRQERAERNVHSERGRSRLLVIGGALLLAAELPAILAGWSGLGLILVPLGLFMAIGGAIQLLLERGE